MSIADEGSQRAWSPMGGTELMVKRLKESLDPALLENFQILPSRVRSLDPTKIRILWMHDLVTDPLSGVVADGGWKKFHKVVFVSNWQMQSYIQRYEIPWSRCAVMLNAIEPIGPHVKPPGPLRLVYTSVPDRGLPILVPAFQTLVEKHADIQLDVFSSYKLYDNEALDSHFSALFDECRSHPQINYRGTVPNSDLREALKEAHIFAYPSVSEESSCLCLMEAMSAGLVCVHPNLSVFPETAANWTAMYQWSGDVREHFFQFLEAMDGAICSYWEPEVQARLKGQVAYADLFYNWEEREQDWTRLLKSLLLVDRSLPEES